MPETERSHQVIQQRIRNRIYEYLELVATHESNHPPFDLNEVLNQWEDWVQQPVTAGQWTSPTYTSDEAAFLMKVDSAWNAFCGVVPETIVDERAALNKKEWAAFVSAALAALKIMRTRGKLSEEHVASP